MNSKQKLAAALAAVSAYLKAEEEQAALDLSHRNQAWSRSGRFVQAQQSNMMQQRSLLKAINFR
ncbi:hypothetical protein [Pelobacter seleniigenes]|uniref:hypothetical protein n=1 Tax=Pelobacter seleniigenes TaxID=407188 RepID=UPI0004A7560B|nr:hypothetical protein [Pelobacter seleniigenes]